MANLETILSVLMDKGEPLDGEFPPRLFDRPGMRPSENVEVREPGNLLDKLDYAETKARRAIIGALPESLRTQNMQEWMSDRFNPDGGQGPSVFGRTAEYPWPTPMEVHQLKREAARPGDPVKPYPEMTEELYGAPQGNGTATQPTSLSAPQNVPLPPPRPREPAPQIAPGPKDSSRLLKDLFGEAATVPSEPQGDVEASDPADLALLAKMGAKNLDLPQAGKVRDPNQLNKDPGPAFWDEGKIDKYAASGIATNPESPIAEYFRQQAAMALGDPRAALLEQLRSGEGDIR